MLLTLGDWIPVKQSDEADRPDIDAFEAAMECGGINGRQRGFFFVFGYSTDAEWQCAGFHKQTRRII